MGMVGGTVPGTTPGLVTDRDFGKFSYFCVYVYLVFPAVEEVDCGSGGDDAEYEKKAEVKP